MTVNTKAEVLEVKHARRACASPIWLKALPVLAGTAGYLNVLAIKEASCTLITMSKLMWDDTTVDYAPTITVCEVFLLPWPNLPRRILHY